MAHSQESAVDYKKRIESLELKLSTTYTQIQKAEQLVKQYKDKYEMVEKQIQMSQISQISTLQLSNQHSQMTVEVDKLNGRLKELQGIINSLEETDKRNIHTIQVS